ncbi:MAG: DHH family phosphoesterase [Nanoarchaeota archaeon]
MKVLIKEAVKKFVSSSSSYPVRIISHFDTDGITSASIMCKALSRAGVSFTLNIVNSLTPDFVMGLPTDSLIVFLDLGSSSLKLFGHLKEVFVIDHHDVKSDFLPNTFLLNPHLVGDREELCSSAVSYLFAKELDVNNSDLASLAIIGSVGDLVKGNGPINDSIFFDAQVVVKKGLLLYPATRPLDKALEFSSNLFIPGVTGNSLGAVELLREANIPKDNGRFKSLMDIDDDENSRLITSIIMRRKDYDNSGIIGNIYLVKLFGKLEDARELSALINACSHAGFSQIGVSFCLNNKFARVEADKIHARYKQEIVEAINFVNFADKTQGQGYVIINSKDRIKDSMMNVVSSLITFSSGYKEGTSIICMSYLNSDKVKVFFRMVGGYEKSGRKADDFISSMMESFSGDWSGHSSSATCTISRVDQDRFVEILRRKLDVEVVQI